MKRTAEDRARDRRREENAGGGREENAGGESPSAEGDLAGRRFGIVAARFHRDVVDKLLAGAETYLRRRGADVTVLRVPGAWEIPLALDELAAAGSCEALVALGVVVRGETPHFDYVCSEASRGCQDVSLRRGIAVGFGLLTTNDKEQALARAGGSAGNKGEEAAEAAVEMLLLQMAIRGADAETRRAARSDS